MKRKFMLIITCIAVLLCMSCNSKKSSEQITSTMSSNGQNKTDMSKSTAPTKSKPLSIGQKAYLGNWKFTIKKTQVKSKILNGKYYYFEPSKGKNYVCLTASVKNTGKKEATFLPCTGYSNRINVAKLHFGQNKYTAISLSNYDKDLLEQKIKPLAHKTGFIVFEVPQKVAKKVKKLRLTIGTDSKVVTYSLK